MIDHLNVLKKVAIGQKFTDFEMPNAKVRCTNFPNTSVTAKSS